MKKELSTKSLFWFLFLAQLVITLIAFNKVILYPNSTMFQNLWDGARNYFSFQTYLGQPIEDGWKYFSLMGYPYGTNVFYVDNTPAIAIPLRWFCMYIYDISPYGVAITNYTSIFFQFISALILFKILNRLLESKLFIIIISLTFAWIHPQILRLGNGHFNLASTWTILLSIYCLLSVYSGYYKNNKILSKKHLIILVCTFWFAAMMHLYYLLIIGILISFFALIWSIQIYYDNKDEWKESIRTLIIFAGICLIVLSIVLLSVHWIDGYYSLRSAEATGYDNKTWKLRFQSLFSHEHFHSISFPLKWSKELHYESKGYLGNFTLYAFLGLLFLRFAKQKYFIPLKEIFSSRKGQFLRILFIVGIISFSISLGEVYSIDKDHYRFYNYTNPMYWLHHISDTVTHFRCVSRFFWIGFWAWNIAMVFIIEHYWRNSSEKFIRYGICVLLIFAIVDMRDFVKFYNNIHLKNYLNTELHDPHIALENKKIDLSKYQATLPIPYFNESCEVKGYILNGPTYYHKQIFSLTNKYKIPTIGVQSGRYPLKHTKEAFSIFTDDLPSKSFLNKLSDKPILVVYHKKAHWNLEKFFVWGVPKEEPARTVVFKGQHLPGKYKMDTLFQTKEHIYFSWDIKALKDKIKH
ncbi:MAG: hypothetical protein MK207_09540 [Saprospiraceae bacterium]|nr:hypothetical protein [Saprospiraceae bacterium]